MNNTFVTWLLGAAIAGLALLLFLATPTAVSSTTAAGSASLTTNGAAPAPEATSYWKDVTPATTSTTSTTSMEACSSCSTKSTGTVVLHAASSAGSSASLSAPAGLMGGCGTPTAPCADGPCGSIRPCDAAAYAGASSGCGVVACGRSSCPTCGNEAYAATSCGQKLSCAAPCDDRPKINRNGPSCVDECSFVQLYSTVPLPVCKSIRFAWAATRGQFLDSSSPTPIYFAPGTGFPGGEDVLITLTVTDAQGNEYSDQMKIHVNDAH